MPFTMSSTLPQPSPHIKILYATQTGISQQVAQKIYRLLFRLHFQNVQLSKMDECNFREELYGKEEPMYCIFVCSTTGQGHHPTNMQQFWKYMLLKRHTAQSLKHVQFTVFGLGDSAYQKYNFVAKKLHRRLLQLGAKEFYERGFGDDQHPHGVEGSLQKWVAGLREKLLELFPLETRGAPAEIDENKAHPAQYEIVRGDDIGKHHESDFMFDAQQSPLTDHSHALKQHTTQNPNAPPVYDASVHSILKVTERVTPQEHWQDVRHMVFDITDTGLRYSPGDVLNIHMQNSKQNVDAIIQRLRIEHPDEPIAIRKHDRNAPTLPFHKSTLTWRELFTHYLDIAGTPPRYFYELLSHFTQDELEKERLDYWATGEGTDDFYRYNEREKRSFLEAFDDFPNATPPAEYILDMIPLMQPRQFSIASAQELHPNEVHIVMAVIKFKTPFERIRYGNCTSWMRDLPVGSRVSIWITKGTMVMAPLDRPMIMIGPGTGVAPFRSFIQYRYAAHQRNKSARVGDIALFFGNRNKDKDFLYEHDWETLSKVEEFPFQLMTAFSRDQDKKIYVQHRMQEHSALIWRWITFENAMFYVAGNTANMPQGVRNTMLQIARKEGGKSHEEAEEWVQRLERTNRYQQETW